MRVFSLTGWMQQEDYLRLLCPKLEIEPLAYQHFSGIEEMVAHHGWQKQPLKPDLLIAWSLGGQVALDLISKSYIKPSKLVLIATPFSMQKQMLESLGAGEMFTDIFQQMQGIANGKTALWQPPARMLQRFTQMIAFGDTYRKQVLEHIQLLSLYPHALHWLQYLFSFDVTQLDCQKIPPSLLIYGKEDVIVPISAVAQYEALLPKTEIHIVEQSGHAPHYHSPDDVRKWIQHYAKLECF